MEEDWEKYTVYAKGDKFTLYISPVTDDMNNFIESRDDLKSKGYKVFVVRMNDSMRAEYVIVNGDNKMIFHHPAMQETENFINDVLGGKKNEP